MLGLWDTLLLPRPGQDIPYLWVILTEPDSHTRRAVMVNLTTKRPHSDVTLILRPGDHPFVRHETVVSYADARMVDAGQLEAAISSGLCRKHQAVDAATLKRIQEGLIKSPFTPNRIKTYVRARET